MHFLTINFGTQWTCSSGQSMIIIMTFPTLAKHYSKSQFMKYENIIHNHGSKKAQTQSNSNIRQEEVVKKEQNYVCIVFQALYQEHCFQKELEPEIPEKYPKSLSQKAQLWLKLCHPIAHALGNSFQPFWPWCQPWILGCGLLKWFAGI